MLATLAPSVIIKTTRVSLSTMMKKRALVIVTYLCYVIAQAGASHAVCPGSIVAEEGTIVTLPCYLDPKENVEKRAVDWRKKGLTGLVDGRRNGKLNHDYQSSEFRNRTAFNGDLRRGDMSVKIFFLKPSDSGLYTCFNSQLKLSCETNLTVVPRDQQNPTKRPDSSTTVAPVKEEPESADQGGANREAGRAVVVTFAVLLLLCVLGILLVKYIRERLTRRQKKLAQVQDGTDTDKDQETGV